MDYKANIWKMYFLSFLANMHFFAGVMIPFFMYWGKISYMQIMMLQALFILSVFILEVPTGAIADRFGRKISISLGMLGLIAGVLIYASIPNIWVFMVGEVIWALGCALISGADEAILYDTLKKMKKERDFKKVLGRYTSFLLLGILVAGPIGSFIAGTIGLRYSMMLMAVPLFFAFLVALTLKEPPIVKKISKENYFKTLIEGVNYFRKHKILKILAFDKIMVWTIIFLVVWTYQPLLLGLGMKLIYLGFVVSAMTFFEIVVINSADRLEKIFRGKLRFLRLSAIICAAAYILAGLTSLILLSTILVIIIAGFGTAREVLLRNYMNKHVESRTRATVMSAVSMFQCLVQGIFYIILGLLVAWSLEYTHVVLGVLILIVVLVSRVEEKHLLD
ncbi:MAG: MFS transporter [archaeon]